MPASATTIAPRTFWSEASLAAAVDAAFAEALAAELATALTDSAPATSAIVLPDTEALIRQAGIVTGSCPPDPRTPSASGRLLKKASVITARTAWWLLKHTAIITSALLVGTLRIIWHVVINPSAPGATEQSPNTGRSISPAEFLEATSEHIMARGWTQHVMESERGVCMLGAQRDLIRSGTGTHATAREANSHLLAVTGSRSVPHWNDRLTRTQAQVHHALLAAAARARAAR